MENPQKSCSPRKCFSTLVSWVLGNTTTYNTCRVALLPLRLMVGVIFAAHGVQKAFGWFGGSGFNGTVGMVESIGFFAPTFWAILLILAELGGGIALCIGLATRLAAFLISIAMVVALCTVHAHDGFLGTHLQQMILAACVTLMIAGGGALSMPPRSS